MGKGQYNSPRNAGPASRKASDAGIDMFELEENLRLTPWERLIKHDNKLKELLEYEAFMEKLHRGWKFIQSSYGYPS